jgi:ferritin-like metal-binding protein YciE
VADPNARDAKLIQYLNEAYGKEKQLETALQAHIAMADGRKPYQKRLKDHLKETKNHSKLVERRIKKLGGSPDSSSLPGPTEAVQNVANRAAALAQGPLHALRGTGENDRMLKNVRTELQDEAEEIGTYTAIQALATAVGDKETAQVAKQILKEEQRMSAFLEKQIAPLTKAVATEEIPAAERRSASSTRRKASSSRKSSSSSSSSRSSGTRKSTSSRSSSSRAKPSSSRSGASKRSTSSRASSSRSSSARSGSSSSRSSGGTKRRASGGSTRRSTTRKKS